MTPEKGGDSASATDDSAKKRSKQKNKNLNPRKGGSKENHKLCLVSFSRKR
jgi:hypothetical protein